MKTIKLLLLLPALVLAYTFSSLTGPTGARNFCGTLMLSGFSSNALYTDVVAEYGFTDRFDAYADVADVGPTGAPAYGGSWVMPRWAFNGNNLGAVVVGINSDHNPWYSPQYHFFSEGPKWVWELNAYYMTANNPYTASDRLGFTSGLVYKLRPWVYPYVELDPSYTTSLSLIVAPGLCLTLPNTPHSLTLALPVTDNGDIGVYAWYTFAITLK